MRGLRQFVEIDLLAQRHPASVDADDFAPSVLIGDADHDLAVEAAGPSQRLVDRVGAIGGGDHDQIGACLQPVHQRQQLRDEPFFRFTGHPVALGSNGIDLVDEHDRGRAAARLLEHLAQPLLALAITRAHDFRAVDDEEAGVAFIGDGLGEARLAGARRTMQQHALGRIDTEADEQFRVAQRQFDHLAQLLDSIGHAADIVVVHHRAAAVRLLEFGAQFDLGILVDVDDAFGDCRNHGQADLGERVCGCVEQAANLRGHIVDRLLPGGGHQIARDQRLAEEVALQRLCRALEPHFAHCRGEHDARSGTRLRGGDGDMFARADFGIAALETIQPDHVQCLVFLVGGHGDGGGGALAGDLEHIALGHPQRLESAARQPGDALAAFILPCRRNLQPDRLVSYRRFPVGHSRVPRSNFGPGLILAQYACGEREMGCRRLLVK